MADKRNLLANCFLLTHKEAIVDTWFRLYYVKTNEYQLHSNFDEFGKNLKAEVIYLFENSISTNCNAKEMQQEYQHFGENRAAISTSLEDLSTMAFSLEAYIVQFLSEEMKNDHLDLSYSELFDYSVRIRAYITDAFQFILSGYMNYFVGTIGETLGLHVH